MNVWNLFVLSLGIAVDARLLHVKRDHLQRDDAQPLWVVRRGTKVRRCRS